MFHQLNRAEILSIVELMIGQVRKELDEKKIALEITEAAREHLGEKGFDPIMGARPLRRLIQNVVEDNLSEEVLSGRLSAGDTALVDVEDGEVVIRNKAKYEEEVPAEAASPA